MLTLRLRNHSDELVTLRDELFAFGARHELSPEEENALHLVLEEIVANIIAYAYTDDAEHEIVVRVSKAAGSIQIEVEDDGVPFDPLQAEGIDVDAPLDQRIVGGAGIHLFRETADELRYRRVDGRNQIALVLKRARDPESQ